MIQRYTSLSGSNKVGRECKDEPTENKCGRDARGAAAKKKQHKMCRLLLFESNRKDTGPHNGRFKLSIEVRSASLCTSLPLLSFSLGSGRNEGEVLDLVCFCVWRVGGLLAAVIFQDPFDWTNNGTSRAGRSRSELGRRARPIRNFASNCFQTNTTLASCFPTSFSCSPLLIAGPVCNIQKEQPTAPCVVLSSSFLDIRSRRSSCGILFIC